MKSSSSSSSQVFAIVCLGIVLANLDLFIVNVALPRIAEDFQSASLEDLSWVLNGYAIAYSALLVFFGRLAERHRRDRSFILGVGVFTVASAACAAAGGVWELVAFRVAQAAGAALMTPTSLGLLLASFPPEQRGSAVRNWAGVGGIAAALGPLAGGVLVAGDWRWIFLVNVPLGAFAMLMAWWKLPEVPGHDVERPSFSAAVLVTIGVAALILAIVKVHDWGWRSAGIGITVGVAVICLSAFVAHCLRSPNPFLDPTLFRIPSFSGATLALTPYSVTFGAMLFSVALWGQSAWGWSALEAGLAIVPGPALVPISSLIFSARLIRRFGASAVVTAGITMIVIGFCFWALFIGLESSSTVVVVGMIFNGIGVGLAFPTLMGISTQALPSSVFATGSGMINMIRQAAIAIGVAIFVAIIGSSAAPQERLDAFRFGWWVLAGITLLALVPVRTHLRPLERPVRGDHVVGKAVR